MLKLVHPDPLSSTEQTVLEPFESEVPIRKTIPDDLEAIYEAQADRLIKDSKAVLGEYPCYPEKYLISREHRRGEHSIEEMFEVSPAIISSSSEILLAMRKADVIQVIEKADLSDMEYYVALRVVYGLQFVDIADDLHSTRQVTCKAWHRACEKIRPLLSKDPMWGLADVLNEAFTRAAMSFINPEQRKLYK